MTVIFAFEASQPDGTVFRMALGWRLHPLASWFIAFGRLL